MIIRIPVVTLMQDCGDGGYTMMAYNTEDEMLADHPALDPYKKLTLEEIAKIKREILTERDPYNNGYIGADTVEVDIDAQDGHVVAKLAKPLSMHVGQ